MRNLLLAGVAVGVSFAVGVGAYAPSAGARGFRYGGGFVMIGRGLPFGYAPRYYYPAPQVYYYPAPPQYQYAPGYPYSPQAGYPVQQPNYGTPTYTPPPVARPTPDPAGRQVVIPADASNGCHTELTVNGHPLSALLDTGTTGMPLVLGSNQAAAVGIPVEGLNFSQRYSSSNGVGFEARVRLQEIQLAGLTMHNVPAVITEASQDEALLGAALLHRLNFTATSDGNCSLSMPVEAVHGVS